MSSNKAISSALVSSPPLLVQSKTGNQNKSVMCHEGCSQRSPTWYSSSPKVQTGKMKSLIFTEIIFCPGLDFLFNDIWKTRQTGRVPYAPVIEWFTMSEAVPSFYWPFCRHLLFYWAFPWVTVWLTKICFYADARSMLGWVSGVWEEQGAGRREGRWGGDSAPWPCRCRGHPRIFHQLNEYFSLNIALN